MSYHLGIDIGSGTSKAVLLRDDEVVAAFCRPSGLDYRRAAEILLDAVLGAAGAPPGEISAVLATGCGAGSVKYASGTASDLRCCARGASKLFPRARTVVDIEGQSSRVLRLGRNGQLADFSASEKCASGSGRFLDVISNVLQIPLSEIGPLSLKSTRPVRFNTSCAVFGESEAVSRVAEGAAPADILAGVHRAMAEKIASLAERVGLEEECVVCGGGALNVGLVKALEGLLGLTLSVPEQPLLVTALGAALLAGEIGTAAKNQ